jgi:hypothetical protein
MQLGALTQDEQIPRGGRFDGMGFSWLSFPIHTKATGVLPSLAYLTGKRRSRPTLVSLCLVLGYGTQRRGKSESGFTEHHGRSWEVLPRWGILPR